MESPSWTELGIKESEGRRRCETYPVQESRFKWYGHVLRREDEYVDKRVMGMEVPGKRRRGRPKREWMDSIRNDLSERELSREDAQDRPRCRRLTRHIDPT